MTDYVTIDWSKAKENLHCSDECELLCTKYVDVQSMLMYEYESMNESNDATNTYSHYLSYDESSSATAIELNIYVFMTMKVMPWQYYDDNADADANLWITNWIE